MGSVEIADSATLTQREVAQLFVKELVAAPSDRRVLLHAMQEVRRHHKVSVRFGFSLVPEQDPAKDLKAGVVAARFISTTETVLAPQEGKFKESERYGYFVYFGVGNAADSGEFQHEFVVPYHANKLVFTVMPFSNPSTKLTSFAMDVEEAA